MPSVRAMARRSFEHEGAELLELVEARSDPGPVPARDLAAVVVHAVEVGAPAGAGPGRHIPQRREQLVGDEELRPPARDVRARLEGPAHGRRRLANLARTVVVPGPPTPRPASEVGYQDRQLDVERGDLVLEV